MTYLELRDLPALEEFGFTGGRDNLRPFAERVFASLSSSPRFLCSAAGELVVFRNKDLQRLAAMSQIGAVPPAVLFGPAFSPDPNSPAVPGSGLANVIANQVFTANAPIHKPLRKTLVSRLGPKQVVAMEPVARAAVVGLLDDLDIGAPVDVVAAIAERLTCEFWGGMLGMTASERLAMEGHVRNLTPMFFIEKTPEDVETFDTAARDYLRIIEAATARSISAGDNSFISGLADDLAAVDLDDDPSMAGVVPKNVASLLAGNLIDGFHTAALAAANTIYVLNRNPDALVAVDRSRDLVTAAIFEALRLEPPVIFLNRWCLEDIVIDGLRVPQGTVVTMMWGVGGYDPTVFDEPAKFNLERSRLGSTTFGGGLHICPGRYVAIMLTATLLDEILGRRWLQRADLGPADWFPGHVMSQLKTFTLRMAPSP